MSATTKASTDKRRSAPRPKARAKRKTGAPATAPTGRDAGDLMRVRLSDIPDADDCREDVGDIEGLAESIRQHGLLQPIILLGDNGARRNERYRFVAGRRRLAAVRRLGWKWIPAWVFPMARADIQEAMAIVENLERRDLTPVEEALAVARLLEQLGVGPDDLALGRAAPPALARAAELLGRTPAWVRGRGVLLRLSPQVRGYVADRRLPLAQAREIAKLASASDQNEVAESAISDWSYRYGGERSRTAADGLRVSSVVEVRAAVAGRLATLRGVPWKPDVAFAGCPACDTCPDNSANTLLFGGDGDDAAPEARCLNTRCYRTKMQAAEKAVRETVKQVRTEAAVLPTVAGVRDLVPDYVKPGKVARELKKARGLGPKKKPAGKTPKQIPWDQRPKYKHDQAVRRWQTTYQKAVGAKLLESPTRLACYLVVVHTKIWRRHDTDVWSVPTKGQRRKLNPLLKRVASGTAEDLAALAADVPPGFIVKMGYGVPDWADRHLAGLLGVNLPPEPRLDDFQPKAEKAKAEPAPAKATKKKAAGKKKGTS